MMAEKPTYEEINQKEMLTKASLAQWRTTFDVINVAVCLLDMNGKILRCNKAMESLLKKPSEEIIGSTCWELVRGTEQSLQEAEAELRHTIEVVPGIIAKANARTGYFTYCNPALSSILGFSSEEFLARPFIEFIHPDDRQSTINEVEKQLKGRATSFKLITSRIHKNCLVIQFSINSKHEAQNPKQIRMTKI
ncbi:MAG: PAS domain-containing protein, partial [Deltaproteobacteria bacterium]|nr:PAS domain-containing protein [Deltaproteobacteria bacterium]